VITTPVKVTGLVVHKERMRLGLEFQVKGKGKGRNLI